MCLLKYESDHASATVCMDDYCRQSEAVDAMTHRTLWESWNHAFAKRHATGVLFWYANTPIPKIGSHAMDGPTTAGFASLGALPQADLSVKAVSQANGARFEVENAGDKLAFMVRIAVRDVAGESLKPTFFTDNWMVLMPHETRFVEVECPAKIGQWSVSSWNSKTIEGSFR